MRHVNVASLPIGNETLLMLSRKYGSSSELAIAFTIECDELNKSVPKNHVEWYKSYLKNALQNNKA